MTPTERIAIYRRALAHFGPRTQCLKAFEEAGEYTAALAKTLAGEGHKADLLGEFADIAITSEQMVLLCGFTLEDLQAEISHKLHRLSERMERTDSGSGHK